MKVALVIDKYDPTGGGAEVWTHQHCIRLLNDGHDVHIVARTVLNAPPQAVAHEVDGNTLSPAGRRLKIPERCAALLETLDADIIHDMGLGWYADIFMPHFGTRRGIYTQQSKLLAPPERWLRPLGYHILPRYLRFKALEARQYRDAPGRPGKHFLAVSRMVRDHMVRFNRADPQRIHVLHNGVDTDRFHPSRDPASRARLRADLGFAESTTVFLLVAHDWELKGLHTLMHAFASLVRAGRDVGLVVVGPGTMRGRKVWGIPLGRPCERYPRLARKLGCDRAVRFTGLKPDPLPYYHAADVYVQPSLYDACSLVVLEAMACGLPVITSQHNGVSEIIEPGRQGHIVADPQDATALAACMSHYLAPDTRQAAGQAARLLSEQHTATVNYEGMLRLYRQVIAQRTAQSNTPTPRPTLAV